MLPKVELYKCQAWHRIINLQKEMIFMKKKTIGFLSLLIILLMVFSQIVSAESNIKNERKAGAKSTSFSIFRENYPKPQIIKPEEKKARHDYIEEKVAELYGKTKSQDEVNKFLEQNGYVLISQPQPESEFTTMDAVANDTVVTTPSIMYDTVTGDYRIGAGFAWKNLGDGKKAWADEASWWCCDLMYPTDNNGGPDVFGIYFTNSDVSAVRNEGSHYLTLWNSDDSQTEQITTPSASTSRGVVFAGQDTIRFAFDFPNGQLDYNWDDGVISTYFSFTSQAEGETYEIMAEYKHTTEDTSINSIGIQPWGISVSWSSSPGGFTATSDAPLYFTP